MSAVETRAARRTTVAGRLGQDLRLVPVAVAAWIAAGVLVGLPDAAPRTAVLGWIIAVGGIGAAVLLGRARAGSARPRRLARDLLAAGALTIGAVALVATTVVLRAEVRAPPALGELRGLVDVVLTVTQEASAGEDRLRGTASSLGAAAGEVPVLVVAASLPADLGIGTTVRVRGTVSTTEPGGALAAIVVADGEPVEFLAAPPDWLAWGNGLRAGFRAVAAGLPGDGGALLTGLSIGDDRGVPQPLADAMRTSSLTHLTAVSGANCALVVGAVMVGGALLGVRRRWRILGALVVLGAFVVLVTPQPSVVRAAVMAAFALGGLAVARPMRGLPLLSLAAAGILVVDPWAGRELGFVLSVLATTGLLVLSGPLGRLLSLALPHRLAVALAIPVAAQLMCQPAIALLDASVPAYGVIANLLAVPAAPLATVAGLLACLVAPLAPPLALGLAWLAWLPSSWIGGVATMFAAMPGARLPWIDGLGGVLLYAFVALAIGTAALGRGPRLRLAGGIAAGAVLVGYAAVVGTWQAAGAFSRPADWQVAMCDVGQGDASVVRSAGEIAVIDTGPDPALLTACLNALGVGRVDLLVLSHFDLDHVGGVAALIGRVDRVLIGPTDANAEARVVGPLLGGGAVVDAVRRGDAGMLGELTWRVLWPRDEPWLEPGNAASVVMRFDPSADDEGFASVFLGDLGESEQARMLGIGPVGRVDVVKVSHHGSADQSERLYAAFAAPLALIGVGADNDYGHPTDRLLDLLARGGTTVGRTDEDGLLLVAVGDGSGLLLWRERVAGPG
ncbi:MAG: ComEC/Rec2 family competence protein [Microbacteriaceae bacterium]|nr:ComEC/Rec2 family competence protein [Microbacteriaceae bacterium]